MQRPAIIQSVRARFQGARWIWIIIITLLILAWRILEGEAVFEQRPAHLLFVFVVLGYLYAVAPIPWQWTGDGRKMAPLSRGILQSFVWNSLWLLPAIVFPLMFWDPTSILGAKEMAELAQHGHVSRLTIAMIIFAHSLWIAGMVGWFIAREEAVSHARVEAEEMRRTLEATARQAQVQVLQFQLDPHVLYNALSGITELIREDPVKAESAVVHLAGLYRKLADLGRRESVTLGEEREVLEDYLAMEQIRLGSRLRITWDWPEALAERSVPPLLFQPLVENAIKHGLSAQDEGGNLLISVTETDKRILCFTVANNGVPLDPNWQEGTGLSNLSERLKLIGAGSNLQMRQEGNMTIAEMYIKSTLE